MRGVGFIFALLALLGCKTSEDVIGSGPLVVSDRITKFYRQEYLKKPGPWSFVISRDGSTANYVYCAEGIGGCQGSTLLFHVLHRCEERAGQPCYLFDEYGHVVWKGPVTFADGTTTGRSEAKERNSVKDGEFARGASLGSVADITLCRQTVSFRSHGARWRSDSTHHALIQEAQARGLTPVDCAQEIIKGMSDRDVCSDVLVFREGRPEWAGGGYDRLVWEAEARKLTPKTCDDLVFG